MRRTVPVTPHNSTVNGSGALVYAAWWAVARWADAWVDDSFAAVPGCAYLHVPSGERPGHDATAVFRVRPVDRLGPRRPVRDAGSATGWAWEPVA